MTEDFLGLRKLEKDLNKSLNFSDIFKEPKPKRSSKKFPSPKPKYTNQKPLLTKKNQQEAKAFIKSTGSAFGSLISNIKNRKIRKLEKETLKNIAKAEAMAHELKTLNENSEALTDIARYEKELEKARKELKERKGQMQDKDNKKIEHSQECKDYNFAFNLKDSFISNCICGVSKE